MFFASPLYELYHSDKTGISDVALASDTSFLKSLHFFELFLIAYRYGSAISENVNHSH